MRFVLAALSLVAIISSGCSFRHPGQLTGAITTLTVNPFGAMSPNRALTLTAQATLLGQFQGAGVVRHLADGCVSDHSRPGDRPVGRATSWASASSTCPQPRSSRSSSSPPSPSPVRGVTPSRAFLPREEPPSERTLTSEDPEPRTQPFPSQENRHETSHCHLIYRARAHWLG